MKSSTGTMLNSKNIKVKLISRDPQINNMHTNSLTLNFSGINRSLISTIRRTCLESIPIYAYDKKYITTTPTEVRNMVNTAYMATYLSTMPIINKSYKNMTIKNEEELINNVIEMEVAAFNKNKKLSHKELEEKKEIDSNDKLNNLHMEINFVNDLNIVDNKYAIKTYTTNDAKFYINGNQIDNIYHDKLPLYILKLKPTESYKATCIAKLNISLYNGTYSSCGECFFIQKDDNESNYDFTIKSLRQISEDDIIIRACKIIILKLNHILSALNSEIKESAYTIGTIVIPNNNHTMGGLITRAVQDHPDINVAGYKMDHLDIPIITINYYTNGNNIKIIIKECFDNLIDNLNTIIQQIKKI